MNIYFVDTHRPPESRHLVHAMQEAVRDFYRGFVLKPMAPINTESENQFFFEGPDGLIWGKVYDRPFCESDVKQLHLELQIMSQNIRESITLFAFFPEIHQDLQDRVEEREGILTEREMSEKTHFLEYQFVRSRDQEGLILRQWEFPEDIEEDSDVVVSHSRQDPGPQHLSGYRFFKEGRLTRLELTELTEIGLRLCRIRR